MAIAGMNWLGKKIGVDILGTGSSNEKEGGRKEETILDKWGKVCFGGQAEQEDDGLPKDDWTYEYNPTTGVYEPTANAPPEVWAKHREQLANPVDSFGKPLNKKPEVLPPPPPPPSTGGQSIGGINNLQNRYLDCFSGDGQPQAPPLPRPPSHDGSYSPNSPHSPGTSTPSAGYGSPVPHQQQPQPAFPAPQPPSYVNQPSPSLPPPPSVSGYHQPQPQHHQHQGYQAPNAFQDVTLQ